MPVLTFPETRQSTSFSCGASATQAILYYYGHEHREDKLIAALGTNDAMGTRPGNIVKYFIDNGFWVRAGQMTVNEVKQWIDRKVPVMVVLQAWTDNPNEDYRRSLDDDHWVVAIGYTDDGLIFDDPSLLDNHGFIPYSEVEDRWHAVAQEDVMLLDHFGIAVWGQKPKFDPNRILKIESVRRVTSRWIHRNA